MRPHPWRDRANRSHAFRWLLVVSVVGFGLSLMANAEEPAATRLFAQYKDRIFQIRVMDVEAEKKSALGTGFLVAGDQLIATNFHVISEYVNKPDKYRLEYVDEAGDKGDLELLDVDVINDLALLRANDVRLSPLELLAASPTQGDTIYSLGNPHDIGFTVIPGTYNGIDSGSYYEHIHFSGSVNPGMSGGPVLDDQGGVVGINVSSAGNQVSFLVPAKALGSLIDSWQARAAPVADFNERIREQLHANQEELIERMLQEEWPSEPLGEATTVGEMKPYVKCWGRSSDEDDLFKFVSSTCLSDHAIFLGGRFSTGVIAYQFLWLEAHELGPVRFQTYYQSVFEGYVPDNTAGEDDVGNFVCEETFVEDDAAHANKAVLCVRAYREFAGLYDALYLSGSVDEHDKAFVRHFTLAGVGRESIRAFLDRFQQSTHR